MELTYYPPNPQEKELFKLTATIEGLNLLYGQRKLPSEFVKLRSLVLDTHSVCEVLLKSIIAKEHFSRLFNYKQYGTKKFEEIKKQTELLTEDSNFSRLLITVIKLGVLSEETRQRVNELNKIRNFFSHESGDSFEYFFADDGQERILRLLKNVVTDLGMIDASYSITAS